MKEIGRFTLPLLVFLLAGCSDATTAPDLELMPSFAKGGKPGKPGGGGGDPSDPLVFTSIETSYHPLSGAFTCAIEDADGDGVGPAYCWGYNGTYALGLGGKKKGSKSEPSEPVGGGNLLFSDVQLGQLFACGIEDADGDGKGPLYCWGWNDGGFLADGTTDTRSEPAPVASDLEFFALDLGNFAGCALAGDPGDPGNMYCWGKWGGGGGWNPSVPTLVGGGLQFTSVATNYSTICGIDVNNDAWCWGDNDYGQVGNGTVTEEDVLEPQPVAGGHKFSALALIHPITCGLTAASDVYGAGEVLCWGGRDEYGQMIWQSSVPELMNPGAGAGDQPFVDLVPGFCATGASGQAYCWGENGSGQIGDGSHGSWVDQPMVVSSPGAFLYMGEKNFHTCGIATDGFAYCWGANDSGELGNGTTHASPVPVKVLGQ